MHFASNISCSSPTNLKCCSSHFITMHVTLHLALFAAVLGTAAGKPEKIRGVSSPVYHLYLQEYPKDKSTVVLGPESSAEYFNIGGTIQSANTTMYLNVGSDSTSYKTLTFSKTASTKAWGLEGDTIITTQASPWGRRKFESLPTRGRVCVCAGMLTGPNPWQNSTSLSAS